MFPLNPAQTQELLPWQGWLSKPVDRKQDTQQQARHTDVPPTTSFYLPVNGACLWIGVSDLPLAHGFIALFCDLQGFWR